MSELAAGYWALLGVLIGGMLMAIALRRYVLRETARAWHDAREAAAAEMELDAIEFPPIEGNSDSWTCAVCGCTNDHACEGGCYWVYPRLCSACAEKITTRGAEIMGADQPDWRKDIERTCLSVGPFEVSSHDRLILELPTGITLPDGESDKLAERLFDNLAAGKHCILEGGIKLVAVIQGEQGNE